jgi:hypothetical protein
MYVHLCPAFPGCDFENISGDGRPLSSVLLPLLFSRRGQGPKLAAD